MRRGSEYVALGGLGLAVWVGLVVLGWWFGQVAPPLLRALGALIHYGASLIWTPT